jgi:general secretion pathway protein G
MGREKKSKKRDRRRAGFSLIEIMVVVMIMGMLASLVGVAVMSQYRKAQRKSAMIQIKNLESALDLYYTDNSRYPSTDQGLKALVIAPNPPPKNYPPNGYLKGGAVPQDPWGNEYIYLSPGTNNKPYTIESYGADGMDGGEADNADVESWSTDGTVQ